MKKQIYPCLWFDNNGKEAVGFYISVFSGSKILSTSPIVTKFELFGSEFLALNGGPSYKMTQAISYTVYCDDEDEINRLYKMLSEGGEIVFPLGKYAWSPMYAWVEDKFGVSWQLDTGTGVNSQRIVPTLLFVNSKNTRVKEAMETFKKVFQESITFFEAPHSLESGMPAGSLLFAQFSLNGKVFNAMSSTMPHDYDFTPGNSFVVECETQEEIDFYWEQLGKDGHYSMCGWLEDRFGVSWQIIPSILPGLMSDPEKAPKVAEAFLKMQKLDLTRILQSIK